MLIDAIRLRSDFRCLYRGVLVCVSPARTAQSNLNRVLTSNSNLAFDPSISISNSIPIEISIHEHTRTDSIASVILAGIISILLLAHYFLAFRTKREDKTVKVQGAKFLLSISFLLFVIGVSAVVLPEWIEWDAAEMM
jgi:hypothetical protein